MNVDVTTLLTLPNVLTFLAEGGAALLVLWMLNQQWTWVELLPPEYKRYSAYVLTFFFAVGFYTFKMVLLQETLPVGWREWLTLAYSVGAPASIGNQLLHARFDLAGKPSVATIRVMKELNRIGK